MPLSLVVGALGIAIMWASGVEFPIYPPPGIIILLAGALFLGMARWAWAPGVAAFLGLFVTVGFVASPDGVSNLAGDAGTSVAIGQGIQVIGVLTALIRGCDRHARELPQSDLQSSNESALWSGAHQPKRLRKGEGHVRKIEEQRGHPRQVRGRDPGRSTVDTTGPMPSEVWTVRAGRAAIIVVRGDLDIASADEPLGAAIRIISENSCDRILVDLADVTFMDAAGLAAVIRARGLANSVGIPLDLVTPSQAASRLLRLTHTERSFRIHDSLDAAMEDSTKSSSAVLLSTAADPRDHTDDSDSGDSPDADETEASSSMDEKPPPRNDMTGEQPNRMKGGRRARTDAA